MPTNAAFCPSCGAAAGETSAYQRPEYEFDRLTKDSRTQDFWLRRVIAYVIDSVIIGGAVFVISLIAFAITSLTTGVYYDFYTGPGLFFLPLYPGAFVFTGISALLYLLYFTLAEATYHKTFGKSILGLRVVTTDGSRLDIGKAFIRNLSKVYWILLLLDLIGGLFTHVQPGQKYSDHIANTNVVSSH